MEIRVTDKRIHRKKLADFQIGQAVLDGLC